MKLAFELVERAAGWLGCGLAAIVRRGALFFLGLRQPAQAFDQLRQAFFVTLQAADFMALAGYFLVDAGQHRFTRFLVLFQLSFLTRLLRFYLLQFGVFFLVKLGELTGMRQVGAQAFDQGGACAGQVSVIVQLARKLVGILLVEQDFQGVVLAVQVKWESSWPSSACCLPILSLVSRLSRCTWPSVAPTLSCCCANSRSLPVGRADGLLGLLQRIGGIGLFAFVRFRPLFAAT